MKTKELLFLTIFAFSFFTLSSQIQLGATQPGENLSDNSGQSVALNGSGNVMVVGAPNAVSNIVGGVFERGGHVRTYGYDGTVWTVGTDFDADAIGDNFGFSVAISEDGGIIACGAPGGNGNIGYVHIYIAQGNPQAPTNYIRHGDTNVIGDAGKLRFGASMAMNSTGTRLIVGGSNYVKVYESTGFGVPWTQIGQTLEGEDVTDTFGVSVGIDQFGDNIIIGNPESGTNNLGYARVYSFDGSNWVQRGQDIATTNVEDRAGHSVDISYNGQRIAVGFPGDDNANGSNAGAVRVYDWNVSSWVQTGTDIQGISANVGLGGAPSVQEEGGLDMNSSGDFIVVGAPNIFTTTTNTGYVEHYQLTDSTWAMIGNTIFGDDDADQFGFSVATSLNGSLITSGARFADDVGSDSGHTKVYDNTTNVLSVESQNSVGDIVLFFPNPSSDIVTISGVEIESVKVYDLNGRVMKELSSKTFSVSDLAKGMYLVKVMDSTNRVITKRMIVQ